MNINLGIAKKVLKTVDAGLVRGIGAPEPGRMCVEAAVCYALGLPHGDNPPCVGEAVRSFKIALNDSARWTSNTQRAKGLRRLAIAQLGSDSIDQRVFVKEIALQTIKKIVPLAFRAAAGMKANAKHKAALEAAAKQCAKEGTKEAAQNARAVYAYTAADAAYAASNVAYTAADAAYAASNVAYAVANAADAVANAKNATAAEKVLFLMADIGVEALKKAGSPGCQWLYLAE